MMPSDGHEFVAQKGVLVMRTGHGQLWCCLAIVALLGKNVMDNDYFEPVRIKRMKIVRKNAIPPNRSDELCLTLVT